MHDGITNQSITNQIYIYIFPQPRKYAWVGGWCDAAGGAFGDPIRDVLPLLIGYCVDICERHVYLYGDNQNMRLTVGEVTVERRSL